jgi:hypothetical protein
MRKKLVLESLTALSIAIFVLAACANLAYAVPVTKTEHLDAGGGVLIDVPGHPKILVVAMHMDRSDFYEGNADRINLFAPGKPLTAYEDNPERKAFSDQVGGGPPGTRPLVKKWQIQTFRICKTVFIYWTIPLVMPATTLTPEVTLPPGCLVLQGYGDAKVGDSVTPFPSTGWTMASHVTGYDAKATLLCPSWHYYGPASETATPSVQTDGTAIWTHP